jgi:hypothetical protein
MAKAIRCEGKLLKIADTKLWIVVCEPEKGGKAEKYAALQEALEKLREPIQKVLHGTVQVTSTEIVRVRVDRDPLVQVVTNKLKRDLTHLFAG